MEFDWLHRRPFPYECIGVKPFSASAFVKEIEEAEEEAEIDQASAIVLINFIRPEDSVGLSLFGPRMSRLGNCAHRLCLVRGLKGLSV